jgi:ferredoxin
MRLVVDSERCQGHNRCAVLAPDLFEIDDFGYAHAIGDRDLAPGQVERAQRAEAECPESAILVLIDDRAT